MPAQDAAGITAIGAHVGRKAADAPLGRRIPQRLMSSISSPPTPPASVVVTNLGTPLFVNCRREIEEAKRTRKVGDTCVLLHGPVRPSEAKVPDEKAHDSRYLRNVVQNTPQNAAAQLPPEGMVPVVAEQLANNVILGRRFRTQSNSWRSPDSSQTTCLPGRETVPRAAVKRT